MANWYTSSVGYTAVAQFAINHSYSIGDIVRQLAAPAVGSERCFRCTTAGLSAGAEAAWTTTAGATTNQGTAVFTEVTGQQTYQGTSWAAPHARLSNALASGWAAAGDTVFVSADHAETSAAEIDINLKGTLVSPQYVYCVTRPSSAIPPATADLVAAPSGSITSTLSSANSIRINSGAGAGTGMGYFYGLQFVVSTGAAVGSMDMFVAGGNEKGQLEFEQCLFKLDNTGATSKVSVGTSGGTAPSTFVWQNCQVSFGAAGQTVNQRSSVWNWIGGGLLGTAPNVVVTPEVAGAAIGPCELRDLDLSGPAGGQHIVSLAGASANTGADNWYNLTNCKLNAALGGVLTGTIDYPGHGNVDLMCSDSASTSREEHYRYSGSVVSDTVNYLTNGATNGTSHLSWKLTSNANANYYLPLYAPDVYQWVPAAGTYTLTMYLSNVSGTSFKDNQFGFDVEFLGTAGVPLGTVSSTFTPQYVTGAALPTDTSAWTGQGGLTKQKVTKSITVNTPGLLRVTPRLALASVTLWLDPLLVVT